MLHFTEPVLELEAKIWMGNLNGSCVLLCLDSFSFSTSHLYIQGVLFFFFLDQS